MSPRKILETFWLAVTTKGQSESAVQLGWSWEQAQPQLSCPKDVACSQHLLAWIWGSGLQAKSFCLPPPLSTYTPKSAKQIGLIYAFSENKQISRKHQNPIF